MYTTSHSKGKLSTDKAIIITFFLITNFVGNVKAVDLKSIREM